MENTNTSTQGTSGPNVLADRNGGTSDSTFYSTTSELLERPPVVADSTASGSVPRGSTRTPVELAAPKGSGYGGSGGASSASAVGSPHPKKFSAVNINKKFLEKNYSGSGSSQPSSTSTPAKSIGVTGAWLVILIYKMALKFLYMHVAPDQQNLHHNHLSHIPAWSQPSSLLFHNLLRPRDQDGLVHRPPHLLLHPPQSHQGIHPHPHLLMPPRSFPMQGRSSNLSLVGQASRQPRERLLVVRTNLSGLT